jgi:hypothetical protein
VVVDSNFDWRGEEGSGACFNGYFEVVDFMPQAPGGSGGWELLIDTNMPEAKKVKDFAYGQVPRLRAALFCFSCEARKSRLPQFPTAAWDEVQSSRLALRPILSFAWNF